VLPPDLLFDVLLRLPAKELCRLRAVCRSWRSLTFDPLFVGEHAARHPLFLANFRDDRARVHVVDLSGNVVKVIPNPDGDRLLPTRLDLACAATVSNTSRVLDPATGSVLILPERRAAVHLNEESLYRPDTSFAFGRIGATGEYKVLRMFPMFSRSTLLCEVLTINGASGSCSSHAQWRARPSNDHFAGQFATVVGEVVYFKVDIVYSYYGSIIGGVVNLGIPLYEIHSFDLGREEWRGTLRGPIRDIFGTDEYDDDLDDYSYIRHEITLADLRGSLALVHYRKCKHIMNLWLLKDFDNGVWVKEYRIQIEPIFSTAEMCVKALFMLDDGRVVIHFPVTGLLFMYDPRTNTSAQVEMRQLDALAMYTGNLLSLQVGDMV